MCLHDLPAHLRACFMKLVNPLRQTSHWYMLNLVPDICLKLCANTIDRERKITMVELQRILLNKVHCTIEHIIKICNKNNNIIAPLDLLLIGYLLNFVHLCLHGPLINLVLSVLSNVISPLTDFFAGPIYHETKEKHKSSYG